MYMGKTGIFPPCPPTSLESHGNNNDDCDAENDADCQRVEMIFFPLALLPVWNPTSILIKLTARALNALALNFDKADLIKLTAF